MENMDSLGEIFIELEYLQTEAHSTIRILNGTIKALLPNTANLLKSLMEYLLREEPITEYARKLDRFEHVVLFFKKRLEKLIQHADESIKAILNQFLER
jgi:hypothetical protein